MDDWLPLIVFAGAMTAAEVVLVTLLVTMAVAAMCVED